MSSRRAKEPSVADHVLVLREVLREHQEQRVRLFGQYTAAKRDFRDPKGGEKIEAYEKQLGRLQALSYAVDVLEGKRAGPGRTLLIELVKAERKYEVDSGCSLDGELAELVVQAEAFLHVGAPPKKPPASSSAPAESSAPPAAASSSDVEPRGAALRCDGCGQTASEPLTISGMRHVVADPETTEPPRTCGTFQPIAPEGSDSIQAAAAKAAGS